MTLSPVQRDRAAGVLLATAAGDALGAGYEFTYPTSDTVIDMVGGGPFGFEPGEWTDDTSMALAVARVTATGLDVSTDTGLDAVAAGFAEWFAGGPKDVGNQTRMVLSAKDRTGAAMQRTAQQLPGLKGGNGSLMRTAAIGIAFLDDEVGCIDAARMVSKLTHDDERAHQACQLWSYAIRHAVLFGNFEGPRRYLETAGADEKAFWGPLLDQAETGSPHDFPKNGWVVHALQTACYAISQADQSDALHLQAALELAVRAGHDTDTTAAIAGGLLGARWGASAVPAAWRRKLHGWPGLRAKDLISLAILTVNKAVAAADGWPQVERFDYSGWNTSEKAVQHPHDDGLFLGGHDAAHEGTYDAIVSLCRMGTRTIAREHVEFWLNDAGHDKNPNLEFVLQDAAETIRSLRSEGKTVLLHCVEGKSRTPSVAARYSTILGRNPADVLRVMTWSRPDPELWATATQPTTCPKQTPHIQEQT